MPHEVPNIPVAFYGPLPLPCLRALCTSKIVSGKEAGKRKHKLGVRELRETIKFRNAIWLFEKQIFYP